VKWKGYDKPSWESAEQFIAGAQEDWTDYNKKQKLAVTFE